MIGALEFRDGDSFLSHIFSASVFVGGFADFVGFEEKHLSETFVSIDFSWQGGGIGDFECEWGDIHDNTTAGISRFSKADRQDITGNAEIFNAARQGKRIWRDNADVGFNIDK